MKINWKEVLTNKATLVALIAAVVSFAYYTLSLVGVTPSIAESEITEWFGMLVTILVMLGIVTNSNTPGAGR
ncbi:phage holin [Chryseobacterium sp.]|uniref:phage holin n=1 Tax=Chryseobacterium sp. TaxID=1871047 RepID=UPI003FA57EAE